MRNVILKASLALLLALAVTDAWADAVLYKLTARDGSITYVDTVPKGFDGNVQRMNIDTEKPVVRLSDRAQDYEEIIRRRPLADPRDARMAEARTRLVRAQEALQAAQENSDATDWIYSQHQYGTRRVPRPEYAERLNQLEANVRAAEESLRTAERGW